MSQLTDFREAIDDFFGNHPQSPLEQDDRVSFTGLNYYIENKDLALVVEADRFPDSEPVIEMETSTGDISTFRRWGRFTFTVDGEGTALTIYSDPHGHDFFMPFKDATNGRETYGAGRYLDSHRPGLHRVSENKFEVDFNYSYNPYCAYSPSFSCPLPPRENWVKVPNRAGEKDYKK